MKRVKKYYSIVAEDSDLLILHIYKSAYEARNRNRGIADEFSEMRPADVMENLKDVRGFDHVELKNGSKTILAKKLKNNLEPA